MRSLLALLTLALLWALPAQAQSVPAPQGTAAIVCAYNATPPTIATGNFLYVQCDPNGKLLAVGGGPNGYIVGNWYLPNNIYTLAIGSAPGANTTRCYPAHFLRTFTSDVFFVRINTLSVGGNIQAAILANGTNNRPTGAALVSTASMSTTTAVGVSSAAAFQFQANVVYWFCTNMDNATSAAISIATTTAGYIQELGDATPANLFNGSAATGIGVTTSRTFGDWSDFSAATWTIVANAAMPVFAVRVGSIP